MGSENAWFFDGGGSLTLNFWLGLIFCSQLSVFAFASGGPWVEHPVEKKWISQPLKSWRRGTTKCFLYDKYWIVEFPYSDKVGEDIFVYRRVEESKFPENCDFEQSKAWVKYSDGDYAFVAISNDILYLDSGTGNWRGLEVISLKEKKRIAVMGYNGSVGEFSIVGDELVYSGPLDEHDEDRASWQVNRKCHWGPEHKPKGWFQEHFFGTRRISLKTGKKTVAGVVCDVGPAAG